MHPQVHEFIGRVKQQRPQAFRGVRVLEIGSYNVNGSARRHFEDTEYVGCDVRPGHGVDIVADGCDLDLPANSFDVVLSTEVFEHCDRWRLILQNMIRMLRAGGLLLVTAAAFKRPKHGSNYGQGYRSLQPADLAEYSRDAILYEEDRQHNDIRLAWIRPIRKVPQ